MSAPNKQIEHLPTESLVLDNANPRLAEFGIKKGADPVEVLQILWEHMAIEELVYSIVAHGFFDTEPVIVIEEGTKFVVIEGNRRLAAVQIILDPSLVDNRLDGETLKRLKTFDKSRLRTLPVIKVGSRQDAWTFIGFKHINGPAKWNSFAKAQYVAQVHKSFGIPLKEIAYQVGDTHNTVQKLFQGMMVIEQAERQDLFHRDDVKRDRLYFSHLYTGLQYEGVKEFLAIEDASIETDTPIPIEKAKELKEVLRWMYGSKKESVEPAIKSQNPDLRRLESVIKKKESIAALRDGVSLEEAFELSRPKTSVFEESLYSGKRELQKAWSFVNEGYAGDKSLLGAAGQIANLADDLYKRMEEIHRGESPQPVRKRYTDGE
ncbi:MAG: ParB N-terminal domain-containing protein [Flavobacteriales bacterium]|nr:ParB N-terminal domain-containing protein [Flavobacteriales bacterium]